MPIVLNGSGPVTGVTSLNTTVSDTEIGYLDGVTSALQTQINTAGGLVKITDATFSAQSAVNVNNCFTSTYENYVIVMNGTASAGAQIRLRMRLSGTDASGANYDWQYLEAANTTISASRSTSQTSADISYFTTTKSGFVLELYGPQLADRTPYFCRTSLTLPANNHQMVGQHTLSTAYDGFSVFPASGTITGTLRVYGFRN